MDRKDTYRVGIRLLGIYFAAQSLVGFGYAFSAYWSAAMLTTASTSTESAVATLKSPPATLGYPIACGVAALILLTKVRAIVNEFELSDGETNGQP